MITSQDIANIRTPVGGGSQDAYLLLQKLQELQGEDERWFVRWKVDPVSKKLTHLFWMSPRQRELARDLYQVNIHDNTYKTNRFKLPAGYFLHPTDMARQCYWRWHYPVRRERQTTNGSMRCTSRPWVLTPPYYLPMLTLDPLRPSLRCGPASAVGAVAPVVIDSSLSACLCRWCCRRCSH